jgi:peptidoglycan lytic transglycosylase
MSNALRSVAAFVAGLSLLLTVLSLVGCSSKLKRDPFAGIGSPVYKGAGPLPKGGGRYLVGEPYEVAGMWFSPREEPDYDQTGTASWYGPQFHRRMTSNGEWFDMDYLSAAHPTLPLPSYAKVTNLENGREIVVRVNDRGPFVGTRIIDLSKKSADALGFRNRGTATVRVQYIGPAPLDDQGSHLAAMNQELLHGIPLSQMIAAANDLTPRPGLTVASAASFEQAMASEPLQPSPSEPGYFIQVGAFANPDNAERARSNLANLGLVEITPVSASAGMLYQVTLRPPSAGVAGQTLNLVRAAGHPDARLVIAQN